MEAVQKDYIFADIPVRIIAHYPYVVWLCRNYEVKIPGFVPQIEIEVRQEELEQEREYLKQDFSDGYLESNVIHHKLCREMLRYDTIFFHASVVAVDGNAYMFAAPSGTGKSTHVRLWKERFQDRAIVVNDDKPFIQIREEDIYACGMPWCGKHGLNSNRKEPIRGICLLKQDTENHIEMVSPLDAYLRLFCQTYRPEGYENAAKAMRLMRELAERVPIYYMNCTISQEAVKASWEMMSRNACCVPRGEIYSAAGL